MITSGRPSSLTRARQIRLSLEPFYGCRTDTCDESAPEIIGVDFGGRPYDYEVFGTISDVNGDLLRVDVALVEGQWQAAYVTRQSDPGSFDFWGIFPGLEGGVYEIFVRAVDAAGNVVELESERRPSFSFAR